MKPIQTLFPTAMTILALALLLVNPTEVPAQRGYEKDRQQAPPRHAPAYGYHRNSPPEQVIRRMPRAAEEHRFRGQRFYSHQGIFYREVSRGFVITQAPVGLRVARLPRGAQKVGRGRDAYYFSQGNYYAQAPRSKVYEVIPEPGRSYRSNDRNYRSHRDNDYSRDNRGRNSGRY